MPPGPLHPPVYTGAPIFAPVMPFQPSSPHGFCHGCGHPQRSCVCGWRECRKEAKELLVAATAKTGETIPGTVEKSAGLSAATLSQFAIQFSSGATAEALRTTTRGTGVAFIGGGCCVHLSVEYAPEVATSACAVAVGVKDSEGTVLIWEKLEPAGIHYQVKEGIITTKPGAALMVLVANAVARVRWCEIFSC
ncbi:MAG TPA: hypothetical protein VET85_06015 [Stellaceae bacterium]|nr:hypothetical protein [Stellaceae bacterium]